MIVAGKSRVGADWRAAFVLASAVSLSIAAYLGFLAPDSISYLRIAQSLLEGRGCSIQGEYVAIWPCGYPAMIALFGLFSHDYLSLILASKAANLFLIVGGMFLLNSVIRDYRMVLLSTVNPIAWTVSYWTISENLAFFALFGIVAATKKLHAAVSADKNGYAGAAGWSAAILVFVVIGFLARYFFATFATVLYAATLFAYGRRTAIAALPAYALAAALFLILMRYNSHATGFGTGMPRMPAPESTRLLVIYSCLQSVRVILMMLPVFVILWPEVFSFFSRRRTTAGVGGPAPRSPLASFLIISGAGYVALQFLIRFFFAYDLFTFRLIGPGFVLLASGLAQATLAGDLSPTHARWFGPSAKVAVLAVYSSIVSQTLVPLGAILADWRSGGVAARELLLTAQAPPTSAGVVFALYRTTLSPALSSPDELYYGAGKTIVYPQYGPEAPPDTAESYGAKL